MDGVLIHVSTIISNVAGEILFVREAKPRHRGRWNLPGGHLELGEHPTEAAIREVREETGLRVTLGGLVGVYSAISPDLQSLRFAFRASAYEGIPAAGDGILEVRWMSPAEVLRKPNSELVGADMLRGVLADSERSGPGKTITEWRELTT